MPYNIAFFINLNGQWTGGFSYYENLLRALRAVTSPTEVKLVGLFPQRDHLYESLYGY